MNFKITIITRWLCLVLCCCLSLSAWAQTAVIKGKVVDKKGEPVIGASVAVIGTSIGTITDINGAFTLNKVPDKAKVKVSYVGYDARTVNVSGQKFLNITLSENEKMLDEVVVVGYGVMRKSDLTGAVSSVKATESLKQMPVSDLSTALQGRLAGVSIVEQSGQPGSNSVIRVRGVNSFEADTGPLIVIDGFIGGDFNSLNPADIESVEVLKDASATAVYGSRGANGVILITTKNPEKGKVQVTYNGFVNMKTPYKLPEVLSAGEFARLANDYGKEYFGAQGVEKVFYNDEQIAEFDQGLRGYDYLHNIFRDVSIEHNHDISISGGSEKTQFLVSGNFNDNRGIVQNSRSTRVNYRTKVDTKILKWLKAGVNIWGNYNETYGPRFSQYEGVLLQALGYPTTIEPKDEDGNYNNMNLNSPQYNPMGHIWEIDKGGFNSSTHLQGYVDVTLWKGLSFKMLQGGTFTNNLSTQTCGADSYEAYKNANQTSATATSTQNINWINSNILSYVQEFNENHRINATLLLEQQYDNNRTNYSNGKYIVSEKIGADNTGMADVVTGNTSRNVSTLLSYMARVNYVLMNRYMFTASFRRDGSSRLAKGNEWENFASGAVAWDMKQENFLKYVEPIDRFKLRFGYGETGNQAVALYSAFAKFGNVRDGYNKLGYKVTSLGNRNLKWERTSQFNLGLDMGFLNNRLTFEIDLYHKLSKDVLLKVNTPVITGFGSELRNAGKILNKGIEVTIGADPFVGPTFSWNTKLVLSSNRCTIEELNFIDNDYFTMSGYEEAYFRNIEGERISSMWGYFYEGVWKSYEMQNAPKEVEPGAYKYKNLDNDPEGLINEKDCGIIGNGSPKFNWGWTNTLTYKDFDFSLFVVGFHGFDIYNHTRSSLLSVGGSIAPNPEFYNRWTPENEETGIAGFVKNPNKKTSTQFVEKGDFVKVKSITLGYTLPKKILKSCHINNFRIYASLQNPFLFTGYSGIDPEVTLRKPLASGVDYGYYPNGRNYLIGINFGF